MCEHPDFQLILEAGVELSYRQSPSYSPKESQTALSIFSRFSLKVRIKERLSLPFIVV